MECRSVPPPATASSATSCPTLRRPRRSRSALAAARPFGGVVTNLIPKEGGNRFSASFFGTYVNRSMEGSNYTPALQAAGLKAPNTIDEIYDYNPGVGGPVVKDKLWFYSAARFQLT